MRKLSVAFIALLFVAAIYTPAIAITPAASPYEADVGAEFNPVVSLMDVHRGTAWKTYDRYEFSTFDGLKDVYQAGEPIVFYVEGKSGLLDVNEGNGFSVIATLIEVSRNHGNRAEVRYDQDIHAWQIRLTAPKDITKEYKLVVNLFCKTNESPCSTTYGFETQVDKIIPIQFR